MGVYLGPFSRALGPTTDLLWWYRPLIYKGLCPICYSKELGFGGFVFVFRFHIFNIPVLEEYVF
jgi:hypothetical protein